MDHKGSFVSDIEQKSSQISIEQISIEQSNNRTTIDKSTQNVKNNVKNITKMWKNKELRKIFLDIIGNTQFRNCPYLRDDFYNILNYLIRNNSTDKQIYDRMFDWVHHSLSKKSRELILCANVYKRSINRVDKIKSLVDKFYNNGKIYKTSNDEHPKNDSNQNPDNEHLKTEHLKTEHLKNENPKDEHLKDEHSIKILDIGCAEGSISVMIGQYFGLDASHMHGCDIIENKSQNISEQMTFTHITDENNSYQKLYDNEQFDIIIALMSLHHIKNRDEILKQIHRILKPNGLFIIREHNCISKGLSLVLDAIHGFYSMVWANPREMSDFQTEYFANYTRSDDLTKIIISFGFSELYNNRFNEYPRFYYGKVINPLNYYYAVYRKI